MTTARDIDAAVAALKAGDVIGLPTETVYGLAGDAGNPDAVARIFAVKGRPAINPLIAHVGNRALAERLGTFGDVARRLADAFWPGPLTLVLPYAGEGVCDAARAGLSTLAVRMPSHPVARAVLEGFGGPLAAPSANPSGKLSPTRGADVRAGLGDAVLIVLEAGSSEIGLESTIVDCSGARPRLLRPGGLSLEALRAVAGDLDGPTRGGPIVAPGALASHYAPEARLRMNAHAAGPNEVLLGFGPVEGTVNLSPRGDLAEAARNLFQALRQLDASGVEVIAVAPVPETGLGLAINDRLRRAAAARPKG